MELLLKNWIGLDSLKLGLEVTDGVVSAAIGATTSSGEVVAIVLHLFARAAPIALAATLLLHLFGISVDVPRLGKIARKMLFSRSRAVCEGDVVTIICLVGAGHDLADVNVVSVDVCERDDAD